MNIETVEVHLRSGGVYEVHHVGNLEVITRDRRFLQVAVSIGGEIMLPRTKAQHAAWRRGRRKVMRTYARKQRAARPPKPPRVPPPRRTRVNGPYPRARGWRVVELCHDGKNRTITFPTQAAALAYMAAFTPKELP
ncbi:MAG TPA: hypothetical protein VFD36_20715 [Kofleriaceae bacterium]|nr:hypothetical protein [Kofleriaceae bacterium]